MLGWDFRMTCMTFNWDQQIVLLYLKVIIHPSHQITPQLSGRVGLHLLDRSLGSWSVGHAHGLEACGNNPIFDHLHDDLGIDRTALVKLQAERRNHDRLDPASRVGEQRAQYAEHDDRLVVRRCRGGPIVCEDTVVRTVVLETDVEFDKHASIGLGVITLEFEIDDSHSSDRLS